MVVLNCTEPAAPKSRFVTSAEHQDIQQPNAIKPDAANAAARPTKALSASIVPNIDASIAEARSNRRATTITTALEYKDAATAAAGPTKALSASRVPNTSAPIAKARSNRRATTETTALECKDAANAAARPTKAL